MKIFLKKIMIMLKMFSKLSTVKHFEITNHNAC